MSNIVNPDKEKRFTADGELAARILELIYEYENEISYVAARGVLLVVGEQLKEDHDD